jgi:hypothetical protein
MHIVIGLQFGSRAEESFSTKNGQNRDSEKIAISEKGTDYCARVMHPSHVKRAGSKSK